MKEVKISSTRNVLTSNSEKRGMFRLLNIYIQAYSLQVKSQNSVHSSLWLNL